MNNKGFTLIELVATIGLLAVVAIISYVSINKVIEESKVNDCEQLVMSIKSAAKKYVGDNRYNVKDTVTKEEMDGHEITSCTVCDPEGIDCVNYKCLEIYTEYLIDDKYLSSPIVNPFDNGSNINPKDIKIEIQLNKDYSVKDVTIEAPSFLKECKSE